MIGSCTLHRWEHLEARYVLSGDIAGVFGSAVSLVADLNRTPIAAEIDASVRFKDAEYFSLETVNSLELWKTDGTTEETELLHVLSSDCLPQGSEPGTSQARHNSPQRETEPLLSVD